MTPALAGVISAYAGIWTPAVWRAEVNQALKTAFGSGVDTSGKLAVYLPPVPGSRPSVDVVPSFTFYRYWHSDRTSKAVGTCVFNTSGVKVVNWPQQQLDNGIAKNNATPILRTLHGGIGRTRGLRSDDPTCIGNC